MVGVFWYGGEREFGRESAGEKVGLVGGVVGPGAVSVLEWWYVQPWWFVVEQLSVDFPPVL